MDKYITSLIQKKNRVIIPEFGAFIVKQGHPKTIVFNEFLKYNDGLLVNEVKEAENISEEEALKKVEEYVSDLNGKLNIGQQHAISGFGILKKDASGRITFKSDESVKSTTPQTPQKPKEEEKTSPETKKEDVPIELDEDKDKKEKTPPPASKPVAKDTKTTAANEVKPKVETSPKEQPEKKQEPAKKKPIATAQKKEPASEPKKYVYSAPKSNRSRNIIWISMVAVIVALISVWLVVNKEYIFDGDKQEDEAAITLRPETEESTASSDIQESDQSNQNQDNQTQADQSQTTPTVSGQQPGSSSSKASEAQATPGQKKYYIVAGCFQYEKNADNYVSYLRDQGFDAKKFGKYGKLHAVSFDSFSSYNEAVNEMNKIKNSTEPEAWILYY